MNAAAEFAAIAKEASRFALEPIDLKPFAPGQAVIERQGEITGAVHLTAGRDSVRSWRLSAARLGSRWGRRYRDRRSLVDGLIEHARPLHSGCD